MEFVLFTYFLVCIIVEYLVKNNTNKPAETEKDMTTKGFILDNVKINTDKKMRDTNARAACSLAKMSLAVIREMASSNKGQRPKDEVYAWLYDNEEMIRENVLSAIDAAYEIAPMRSVKVSGSKYPISFVLAYEYLKENKNKVDEESLITYLHEADLKYEFRNRELTCFDTMLKLALSVRMAGAKEENVSEIENAVTSLRSMSLLEYSEIFFKVSPVELILSDDPAGVYSLQDAATRSFYHSRVEKLSHIEKISEREAARKVLNMAQNAEAERERHVGYYLTEGIDSLNHEKESARAAYVFYIAAPTILGAFLFALFTNNVLVTVLGTILLFEAVKKVVTHVVLSANPPDAVLRMDLSEGIPDSERTLAVISVLLDSPKSVSKFSALIEEYYLSNRDDNLYFGILGDLKDTKAVDEKADSHIVELACEAVLRLNEKYEKKPFCLFVRRRQYNKRHRRYMSYERKRGAIMELSRLISKGERGTFSNIICSCDMSSFEHVVTLDFDTRPSPYSIKKLVEAAAHPQNKPVVSADGSRVASGYGILQPRIVPELLGEDATLFSRMIAGNSGISAYSNLSGDLYQDLFGDGTYIGKGLFSPRVFCEVLSDAIQDNAVLSHDLLEGAYVRTGFVSDVEWTDGTPSTLKSFFMRQSRWTRGDFQLLPWLFWRVKNKNGKKVKNPIGTLGRVKIFENLFRSLVPLVMLITVATAVATGSVIGYSPFILMLVNLLLPTGMSMLSSIRRKNRAKTCSRIMGDVSRNALWALVSFSILPFEAVLNVSAALVSIWRVVFTRRNLLNWSSAQFGSGGERFGAYIRYMFVCPLTAVVLLWIAPSVFCGIISVIYIGAPVLSYEISKKRGKEEELTRGELDILKEHARLMWGYFSDLLNEGDNYLIPDNFQVEPYIGAAHRTSPTNIGLSMLCMLSAYDFSFIDKRELFSYVENTLSAIERLEKCHGHLYNWYDTQTLEVLPPRYVSTVDSGNFAGYIITLTEGLKQIGADESLTSRLTKLIDDMDFSMLYSKKRKLFHVGYNADTKSYDESYYDLLASEARQTSYIATALCQVPVKHWGALSRICAKVKGFGGLYSWTGTMFEYFMPSLIMPPYFNSLIYESQRFAVFCQRLRAGKNNAFGISESAYCAFDGSFAYQYKAFGLSLLAQKRDCDDALVISPYSTYLSLMTNKREGYDNLIRLCSLSTMGKYGFYESIDFQNPVHGEDYALVKTFMAHHIGMSMLSCANVVFDNIMQKRFMSDARMSAFSPLLKERAQLSVTRTKRDARALRKNAKAPLREGAFERIIEDIDAFVPRAQVIGSRRYCSVITDSGVGFSKFDGLLATRRAFHSENPNGTFFFAGDFNTRESFSLTFAPSYDKNVQYSAKFSSHSAKFTSKGYGFDAVLDVISGAGKPLEARCAKVKNTSENVRDVCISLYFEPVLASYGEDLGHRTFSNLFIETSYVESDRLVIVKRRARDGGAGAKFLVAAFYGDTGNLVVATRRGDVRGRLSQMGRLSEEMFEVNETFHGSVTDPCVFARADIRVEPGESAKLGLVVASGGNLSELLTLCRNLRSKEETEILVKMAQARAAAESDVGKITNSIRARMLDILPCFYINMPCRDKVLKYVKKNTLSQGTLWKYSISGDYPIMLFELKDINEQESLLNALKTFLLLYMRGICADIVVIYRETGQYMRPLSRCIDEAVNECSLSGFIGGRGGIHVINLSAIPKEDEILIYSCASYIFGSDTPVREKYLSPKLENILINDRRETDSLEIYNGFGGFLGNAYVVNEVPPAPYSYVMSNGVSGTLVTSTGGGFSFTDNARENKLSPMSFDPLTEEIGENVRLIVDGKEIFLERPVGEAERHVKYESGCAEYFAGTKAVDAAETVFVPRKLPVVLRIVTLKNNMDESVFVRTVFSSKLVLGVDEESSRHHIVTSFDEGRNIITARNAYNGDFSNQTAYIHCGALSSFTCEYEDVLKGEYDTKKTGVLRRACFCACIDNELSPGESLSFVLIMGRFESESQLEEAVSAYGTYEKAAKELSLLREGYKRLLSKIEINSPDKQLNLISNERLLYQTYVCRVLARTSFYQCGGAWGFRDQLQDCLAVLYIDPDFVRNHILRACSHQFLEGDVQHWWHPIRPLNDTDAHRGVRTRYTDDRLWLVYVAMCYAKMTDDYKIFDESVPFIEQAPLKQSEQESYYTPKRSKESASVFEHCVRAVEVSMDFGEHGLCKIGGGDWNDGFNNVGAEGKGESVWLSWFFSGILSDFSEICEKFGRFDLSARYRETSKELVSAIEDTSWDSDRYLRAFYDDGTPMGAHENDECKIDSLSQSFSVISQGDVITEKKRTALISAVRELYDRENKLVKLFSPPFDDGEKKPGYVKGYTPGVRENGGQYTHASIWLCRALFMAGENDIAYELLSAQNPINHADTKLEAMKYKVEPYVISADVYSGGEKAGMGGWSWYTGAAAWYYIVVIEDLFGLKRRGDRLIFSPHLPSHWNSAEVSYDHNGTRYNIRYVRVNKNNTGISLSIDGKTAEGNEIILSDDKNSHNVLIEV